MSPRAARIPGRYWAVGLIAGMASYLDAAALATFGISLSIWQQHFGLGAWQTGLASSGLAMSFAIGALTGGWLGDRFGRIRMLGIDLAVFIVGCLIVASASNGTVLVLGGVIVGLAAGADLPVSLSAISELVPIANRGRLVGLTQVLWISGIVASYLLGFALAGLGHLGTQIMLGVLSVLGAVAWLLRARLRAIAGVAAVPERRPTRVDLRPLLARDTLPTWLALTGFVLIWNIASTTLGSFGPYYLVRISGLSQAEATGLVLITFPLSLLTAATFARLADTPWRDRLFVVAMLLQIAAFLNCALTGGILVWGMVILVLLYSLSNSFAGEAAFKVWGQLLYPSRLRATATGASIALARAAAATILLVTPALIAAAPAALLWVQLGCVTVSGCLGLLIIRRLLRRRITSSQEPGREPALRPADDHQGELSTADPSRHRPRIDGSAS